MAASLPAATCWVNGRLVGPDEASITAFDHAVVVGDAVFETMKVVNGTPFTLTRHLRRLNRSASGLGLSEVGEARLRSAIDEVLTADPDAGLGRCSRAAGAADSASGKPRI